MIILSFERVSPEIAPPRGPDDPSFATTFRIGQSGGIEVGDHLDQGDKREWWDCCLTVLGDRFEFSFIPELCEAMISASLKDMLAAGAASSSFLIPGFDSEVVLQRMSEDEFRVTLMFGGKDVESGLASRSVLLGLLAQLNR